MRLLSSCNAGSPECRRYSHRTMPVLWSSTVSHRQSYRASRLPPKYSGKSTALAIARNTAERLRARSQSATSNDMPSSRVASTTACLSSPS
ncbi:Uncharacterised protein [Bordetella pertussis]|nr:Uncharacterised protein [Bordetella pertussis]